MTPPDQQSQWLADLSIAMRREVTAQRESIGQHWAQPLQDRVKDGRTLGPLTLVATAKQSVTLQVETSAGGLSDTHLREGDFVRLSRDRPAAPSGHYVYLGEDADGIHLTRWKGEAVPDSGRGWTIDPDFFDLSGRFAEAIDALGATRSRGRRSSSVRDRNRDPLPCPGRPPSPTARHRSGSPGLHREVLCDTVERFQGQEREVMIVSFVSSHHPFIELRADFLFQPQRLNVAVTRARVKTIVLASRQLVRAAEKLGEAGHEGAASFTSLMQHLSAP